MIFRPMRFFTILMLSVLFFAVCAVSCKTASQKENKPAAVATKFLNHLRMFEFDEARKYGTEATGKMLDMFSMMLEMSKKNGKEPDTPPKAIDIQVVKTAIDGKNAVVTYKNEEGKEQQLDLVKVKGKWLVNMKKETPALTPTNKG